MADHSKPTVNSRYDTEFVQELDARLDDITTLQKTPGTNLPDGAIQYDRVNDVFKEWNAGGASWNTAPIALAGLTGLGTIASQNANAVSITGGTINGVALNASDISSGTLNAARLSDSGASAGTYGDGSNVPVITVDAKGRITTITTTPAGAAGVPSGLIAIFDTSCPTGWTRVTAFDNLFIRGGSTYGGTGGASTHAHTIDAVADHQHGMGHSHPMSHGHGHSLGTDSQGSHTHGFTTVAAEQVQTSGVSPIDTINSAGSHSHGITGGVSNFNGDTGMTTATYTANGGAHTHTAQSASSLPPYINVVFCKKN